MRPYVESVYSNLKSPLPGGEAWKIDLSQRTLFVGSNTSHKSGVIQSIELALAGSADDIFGRSAVSDAALLLTLAPNDELGVSATLSDQQVASFNAKREGSKVKRPTHDGPGPATLVHRSVASALSGSPASARKAFLAWSGNNIDQDSIVAYLPESLQGKYKDIAEHKGRGKSSVETLIDVAAYAGQRQREASKEAKGAEIILESLGDKVEARPSDEDMTKMRFAVAEAREILDLSVNQAKGGLSEADKDQQMVALNKKRDAWLECKSEAEFSLRDLKSQLPYKGENVDNAIAIVDIAVKHELSVCPVCSSRVGLKHLKNCQGFYQAQHRQWEDKSKQVLESIRLTEERIVGFDRNVVAVDFEIEELNNKPITNLDSRAIPITDAQSRLQVAMDALTKMDVSCSQWDNIASARNKVVSMQADATTYKELKSACEVAIGKLLGEQAKSFSSRVQKYLPKQWDFNIELVDGGREVFRMGLMRDGKLHAALSGAEWTSVVTAIAMAVTDSLPDDYPAVLIPEDRAWDGKTLASVMRGFSSFDGQVVMASTTRPAGKTPKGWTIIDMDEVSASWLGSTDEKVVEEVVEQTKPVSKTSLNHASGGFRVTSRSALILEEMGFDKDDIQLMSRDTVSQIIKSSISPDNVRVKEDGSFYTVKSGNVLTLPPSPKA
tara:strand:+ start:1268 stop:3268 length:2001 start_codon:yes stop_codon:yes gene_type:complete